MPKERREPRRTPGFNPLGDRTSDPRVDPSFSRLEETATMNLLPDVPAYLIAKHLNGGPASAREGSREERLRQIEDLLNLIEAEPGSHLADGARLQIFKSKKAAADYLVTNAGRGEIGRVERILERFPELINKTNILGKTPLWAACFYGHLDVVNLLLKKENIDVNKADDYGETPLEIARRRGQSGIVELLEKRIAEDAMET